MTEGGGYVAVATPQTLRSGQAHPCSITSITEDCSQQLHSTKGAFSHSAHCHVNCPMTTPKASHLQNPRPVWVVGPLLFWALSLPRPLGTSKGSQEFADQLGGLIVSRRPTDTCPPPPPPRLQKVQCAKLKFKGLTFGFLDSRVRDCAESPSMHPRIRRVSPPTRSLREPDQHHGKLCGHSRPVEPPLPWNRAYFPHSARTARAQRTARPRRRRFSSPAREPMGLWRQDIRTQTRRWGTAGHGMARPPHHISCHETALHDKT